MSEPFAMETAPAWPISLDDVRAAKERLAPYLTPTPLRHYPPLNELMGGDTSLLVKHENHLPVQTFKVRNGLSALTALGDAERSRGVIGASTGNHGQGMAYAAQLLGIPCTIVVPVGNNPDKNAAIRALGATLVEFGTTYDASAMHCAELAESRGLTLIHGINNLHVMAGAATMNGACVRCHADMAPAPGDVHADSVACIQCHGAHGMRPVADPATHGLAVNASATAQMQQRLFDLDTQQPAQLACREPGVRFLHEALHGGQQGPVAGKPHRATGPQPAFVKPGNARERVVLPAMRVAGPIAQGFELPKHRHGGHTAQRRFQFWERGDLLPWQERSDDILVESHVV